MEDTTREIVYFRSRGEINDETMLQLARKRV